MSELSVGSLSGLAANSYVIDVASGSTLDLSNATDLPVSALPAGSILQVVSTTKTDTFSTTSASFTDITGLSATITPSSTSSKIFISYSINSGNTGSNNKNFFVLNSSLTGNLLRGDSAGNRIRVSNDATYTSGSVIIEVSNSFLDSPNSTSAITYDVKMAVQATGYVNRTASDTDASNFSRQASTITVMEIAG